MIFTEKCAEAVFQLTEAIAEYEKFDKPNPAWYRATAELSEELQRIETRKKEVMRTQIEIYEKRKIGRKIIESYLIELKNKNTQKQE